jgi:hypothetical protein
MTTPSSLYDQNSKPSGQSTSSVQPDNPRENVGSNQTMIVDGGVNPSEAILDPNGIPIITTENSAGNLVERRTMKPIDNKVVTEASGPNDPNSAITGNRNADGNAAGFSMGVQSKMTAHNYSEISEVQIGDAFTAIAPLLGNTKSTTQITGETHGRIISSIPNVATQKVELREHEFLELFRLIGKSPTNRRGIEAISTRVSESIAYVDAEYIVRQNPDALGVSYPAYHEDLRNEDRVMTMVISIIKNLSALYCVSKTRQGKVGPTSLNTFYNLKSALGSSSLTGDNQTSLFFATPLVEHDVLQKIMEKYSQAVNPRLHLGIVRDFTHLTFITGYGYSTLDHPLRSANAIIAKMELDAHQITQEQIANFIFLILPEDVDYTFPHLDDGDKIAFRGRHFITKAMPILPFYWYATSAGRNAHEQFSKDIISMFRPQQEVKVIERAGTNSNAQLLATSLSFMKESISREKLIEMLLCENYPNSYSMVLSPHTPFNANLDYVSPLGMIVTLMLFPRMIFSTSPHIFTKNFFNLASIIDHDNFEKWMRQYDPRQKWTTFSTMDDFYSAIPAIFTVKEDINRATGLLGFIQIAMQDFEDNSGLINVSSTQTAGFTQIGDIHRTSVDFESVFSDNFSAFQHKLVSLVNRYIEWVESSIGRKSDRVSPGAIKNTIYGVKSYLIQIMMEKYQIKEFCHIFAQLSYALAKSPANTFPYPQRFYTDGRLTQSLGIRPNPNDTIYPTYRKQFTSVVHTTCGFPLIFSLRCSGNRSPKTDVLLDQNLACRSTVATYIENIYRMMDAADLVGYEAFMINLTLQLRSKEIRKLIPDALDGSWDFKSLVERDCYDLERLPSLNLPCMESSITNDNPILIGSRFYTDPTDSTEIKYVSSKMAEVINSDLASGIIVPQGSYMTRKIQNPVIHMLTINSNTSQDETPPIKLLNPFNAAATCHILRNHLTLSNPDGYGNGIIISHRTLEKYFYLTPSFDPLYTYIDMNTYVAEGQVTNTDEANPITFPSNTLYAKTYYLTSKSESRMTTIQDSPTCYFARGNSLGESRVRLTGDENLTRRLYLRENGGDGLGVEWNDKIPIIVRIASEQIATNNKIYLTNYLFKNASPNYFPSNFTVVLDYALFKMEVTELSSEIVCGENLSELHSVFINGKTFNLAASFDFLAVNSLRFVETSQFTHFYTPMKMGGQMLKLIAVKPGLSVYQDEQGQLLNPRESYIYDSSAQSIDVDITDPYESLVSGYNNGESYAVYRIIEKDLGMKEFPVGEITATSDYIMMDQTTNIIDSSHTEVTEHSKAESLHKTALMNDLQSALHPHSK